MSLAPRVTPRARASLALATAVLALSAAAPARAAWPDRPVTLIVPFAAGGPSDIVARIVAEPISRALGQPVIIENVAGGGGTEGALRVARAAPDGYTLLMGHMGTHGSAPAVYPELRYDPVKDFAPIGLVAGTPVVVVARKDFPPKDLRELVAYLRANSERLNEANAGVGSVSYAACSLLDALAGARPARIVYRGTGPALNDLVAGQVDYMCDQIVNLVPSIQSGAIRAYAVALPERSPALPGVPTTREAGLPELQVTAWNALFAPKGTPPAVVKRLSGALLSALGDAATRKRLLDLGGDLSNTAARTPEGLQRLVEDEVARWNRVLRPPASRR